MNRIVLAFSGNLDAAAAIPWLTERYRVPVVTLTLDLGRGGDLEEVRDRALSIRAARAHVLEVRDTFTVEYMLRALKAGALGGDEGAQAAALERALVAEKLVEVAALEQATAVAHLCREKETPIDAGVRALAPELEIVAP